MAACVTDPVVNPPPIGSPSGIVAPKVPFPPFGPSTDMPDLKSIFDLLSLALPPGTLKPLLSPEYSRSLLDGVISLLEKFTPFLYLYTFFLPVLNIILCIIEVLCSLKNPFKLVKAIRRLFRVCIPDFLALFPQFALLVMIISLLLLLIALIEYIISQVADFITTILENVKLLTKAVDQADADSILSITKKIGNLICDLQNLFLILSPFIVIFELINFILTKSFRIPPCESGTGDDFDCCDAEVCPAYLKNTIYNGTSGTLKYLNKLTSSVSTPGTSFITVEYSTLRNESWQYWDGYQTIQKYFYNITHAYDLPEGSDKIFFPDGTVFDKTSKANSVPYAIDISINYNPNDFSRIDALGTRKVVIKNCIVTNPPTNYNLDYQNGQVSQPTGVFDLTGGLVYEKDGVTPVMLDGVQATLNTLIHLPEEDLTPPVIFNPLDGYEYGDSLYSLKINHDVLFNYDLITLGCMPDVAIDKNTINATVSANLASIQPILETLLTKLPDINATNICLDAAINKFISNVSVESVAIFSAEISSCLGTLKDSSVSSLIDAILAAYDPYNSSFTLVPTLQFVNNEIQAKIILKDKNNNEIAKSLPASVSSEIAKKITMETTFGTFKDFTYNLETGEFISPISSDVSGKGTAKAIVNGKTISTLTIPTDLGSAITVEEKILSYEFIGSDMLTDDGKPRRDYADVSSGSNGVIS